MTTTVPAAAQVPEPPRANAPWQPSPHMPKGPPPPLIPTSPNIPDPAFESSDFRKQLLAEARHERQRAAKLGATGGSLVGLGLIALIPGIAFARWPWTQGIGAPMTSVASLSLVSGGILTALAIAARQQSRQLQLEAGSLGGG